jgi:prevent-host-death family protein
MAVFKTHEAKTNLSRLLDEVQEGEEVIIAKGNRPVARLIPFTAKKPVRKPGYLQGKIRVAADFDAPLPDDILNSFESGA